MGEERITALLQESLAVAVKSGAMKPANTRRVVVDTTVEPKTDAKLIHRARERLGHLARQVGLDLRQTYVRVGKPADQAPALCTRQAVQAGQQRAAQAEDLSRPDHSRHLPPDCRRRRRSRRSSNARSNRYRRFWSRDSASAARSTVQPACAELVRAMRLALADALDIRRLAGYGAAALKRRPVRPARESTAGQSL